MAFILAFLRGREEVLRGSKEVGIDSGMGSDIVVVDHRFDSRILLGFEFLYVLSAVINMISVC